MADTPKSPDPASRPTDAPAGAPACDEFSGGGGSATGTRHRGLPGDREGDCDRVGNDLPAERQPGR